MRIAHVALLCAVVAFSQLPAPAFAGDTDPLFVNATTDQPHRVKMALVFAKGQLERKHPVAIFLNDRGVLVASKANTAQFQEQQELLKGLMASGATIIVCPMCMEHYGVKPDDLLAGVALGSPEVVGGALFKDSTKTMTW